MRKGGNTHAYGKVENNSPFILRLGLQVSGVTLSDMPVQYALVVEASYALLGQIWLDDSPPGFALVQLQRFWDLSQV